MTDYVAAEDRYSSSPGGWFRRCGSSGLLLPAISLGCWHNFGGAGTDSAKHSDEGSMHENCQRMLFRAFDLGVTHFDLANNYGPPAGSAEERVGRILREDFGGYRDELILSSKAGYMMWPGPYGEFGSRKYLIASCDASLQRMGLDYFDIFYSHRPDEQTPLEETMGALDQIVRSGKALYSGISSYDADFTAEAIEVCERNGFVKPLIHQPSYNMLDRWIEGGLMDVCGSRGMGMIAFCPLAQGLLTTKYLEEIPEDSRVANKDGFLQADRVTEALRTKLRGLQEVAQSRGQSLAQLALAWALRDERMTSLIIGASRPEQIEECVLARDRFELSGAEVDRIEVLISD